MASEIRAKLILFGSFGLLTPAGDRLTIASRKGRAMIAMLAMSPGGGRSRGWLQERLWGGRERLQAQNSLRREIVQLRKALADAGLAILDSDGDRVALNLAAVDVDAMAGIPGPGAEFLEGLDIPGAEGFEDWLRDQRQYFASQPQPAALPAAPPAAPPAILAHFQQEAPSMAILPFTNLTGDADNAYLAEGIGDDLIDRVARLRWLPVISPGQSFRAGGDETLQEAGRRLGATYVLGGRLRLQDGEYWLTAQAVETATGRMTWSFRTSLKQPQAADAMNPLIAELVAGLENRIANAEQARALIAVRPAADLGVQDHIWRGRWHLHRLTHADSRAAITCLEAALAIDPNSSEALIQLAMARLFNTWAERGAADATTELRKLAQRAMLADHQDGRGYALAAIVETWMRRPERAEKLFEQAIALNPSLAMAWAHLGGMYNLSGQPAKAIAPINQALRLAPHDEQVFYAYGEMAMARLLLGEWAEAIEDAERALVLRPAYWYAHVICINALIRSDQPTEAAAAHAELLRAKPRFVPAYIDWLPYLEPESAAYLKSGLAMLPKGLAG